MNETDVKLLREAAQQVESKVSELADSLAMFQQTLQRANEANVVNTVLNDIRSNGPIRQAMKDI